MGIPLFMQKSKMQLIGACAFVSLENAILVCITLEIFKKLIKFFTPWDRRF